MSKNSKSIQEYVSKQGRYCRALVSSSVNWLNWKARCKSCLVTDGVLGRPSKLHWIICCCWYRLSVWVWVGTNWTEQKVTAFTFTQGQTTAASQISTSCNLLLLLPILTATQQQDWLMVSCVSYLLWFRHSLNHF